jgi:2-C-methyl-D-erythritol 4-phosphate cytidylyltransferase
LGADHPKQHVLLAGRPLLERTVEALESCAEVEILVVSVEGEGLHFWRQLLLTPAHPKVRDVVQGGGTRAFSVRNGLHRLVELEPVEWVGVHDGARPLVSCGLVRALMERLTASPHLDGVLPSLHPTDSIKEIDGRGMITQSLDRSRLVAVQTPQVFRTEVLLRAYDQPDGFLAAATDDASLVERVGGRVGAVPGEWRNLKVTNPFDLTVAELLLGDGGCDGC